MCEIHEIYLTLFLLPVMVRLLLTLIFKSMGENPMVLPFK